MNDLEIARRLDEVAELLAGQEGNPFRVAAYRRAAAAVRGLERPVEDVLRTDGRDGLARLLGVGSSLARTIEELATTGRLAFLDRLRGQVDPEALLADVAGIGMKTAHRIHAELGITSLEDLELAAHDGRLQTLRGFGPKKLQSLRDTLAGRLRRRPSPGPHEPLPAGEPPVAELLDMDAEYRHKAERGALPTIAPRRFNPSGEACLPILHTERGPTRYTVLFSNTARAHALGATRDWVVIYFDDGVTERQRTVVTERRAPLAGRRALRGREAECRAHYAGPPAGASQAA